MFKNFHSFVLVVLAIAVIGLAANVQAETIHVYDFEGLDLGDKLIGQDNWESLANRNGTTIASGDTGWEDQGQYARSGVSGEDTMATRANSAIPADTDFDVSAIVQGSSISLVAFQPTAEEWNYGGLTFGVNNTSLKWYNNAGANLVASTANNSSIKYLVGVHVTWSAGTYTGQAYYQDLTTPGTQTNVGSAFTLVSDPTTWDSIACRLNTSGKHAMLDDITISYVPEPSMLALLACGVVGLLAYAWRKRR